MSFESVGHGPTEQHLRLGAAVDGKLVSLEHDYQNDTSIVDDHKEECGEATAHVYSVPNLRVRPALVRRNVGTPTAMRGPGAVPGLFATESAMDELAIKLNMDPVELRLKNEPEKDEGLNLPFSSRHLKECLTLGAQRFGWAKRTAEVGSRSRARLAGACGRTDREVKAGLNAGHAFISRLSRLPSRFRRRDARAVLPGF